MKGAERLTVVVEGPTEEVSAAASATEGVISILKSTAENGNCSLEMKVEESTLEDVFIHMMSGSEEMKA